MLHPFTLKQLRPLSIGFDDFFNFAESFALQEFDNSFPKYDLVKVSDTDYSIEMALAGYSKSDIDVVYQDGILTVSHAKEVEPENKTFLHRGISKRAFTKSFTLAENVKVLKASFIDGLLVISLEKVIPEEKKPRTIEIV